jgi:hypothetical protein
MRPAPAFPIPSRSLLDLCSDLLELARDLSAQAANAAADRPEVLGKLDGITTRVAEAREEYLAATGGLS